MENPDGLSIRRRLTILVERSPRVPQAIVSQRALASILMNTRYAVVGTLLTLSPVSSDRCPRRAATQRDNSQHLRDTGQARWLDRSCRHTARDACTGIPAKDANTMFEVNITGVFMTAQAVAKEMIKHRRGGSIAMIASMSGTVANRVSVPRARRIQALADLCLGTHLSRVQRLQGGCHPACA